MRKERKGSHGGSNVGGKRKRRRSSTRREKVRVKHDACWMGLFICLFVCLLVCLFLYYNFFTTEREIALTSFSNLRGRVMRKFVLFQLLD